MRNKELLREYAKDVNQWVDLQGNPEEGIRRRIAILERRLILLDASSEALSLTEQRKNILKDLLLRKQGSGFLLQFSLIKSYLL